MRFHRLRLENFRCFEQREFEFRPGFNLVVGDNASGKTALLEALSLVLDQVLASTLRRGVAMDGFPWVRMERGGRREVRSSSRATIEAVTKSSAGDHTWHFDYAVQGPNVRGGGWRIEPADITNAPLLGDLHEGKLGIVLPLVRRFGEHRVWRSSKHEILERRGRLDAYDDALRSEVTYDPMNHWLRWQEAVLAQGHDLPQAQGVQRAITRVIHGAKQLYFDFLNNELRLEFEDGRVLPFAFLSAGYRSTIAMIADLAYRCAELNPELGAEAPELTPGVVLIDELDLHLHPNWQRRIIGDLQRAFPLVQFVATTHSPFVIQSLEQGHLINLGQPTSETWRRSSIEDIAEGTMGVEGVQRSERFNAMVAAAERYYALLDELRDADDERVVALKTELDALMIPYGDDPAYVALLKFERTAAEAARGRG